MRSDPPPLAGAAPVVGLRGHVSDAGHLEPGGLQRADRRLAPGAGALHEHLDLLEPVLHALLCGRLGGHLRGERRGLAGALESGTARGLPGDHVALAVRQRDDGVVERSLDVGLAVGDVLADPAAWTPTSCSCLGHLVLAYLLLLGDLAAPRSLAAARVRLCALAAHWQP